MAADRSRPPIHPAVPAAGWPIGLLLLLLHVSGMLASHHFDCDFEAPCSSWHWKDTEFKITNDSDGTIGGGRDGQFLWTSGSFPISQAEDYPKRAYLKSNLLHVHEKRDCAIKMWLQTGVGASLMVSVHTPPNNSLVIKKFGEENGRWHDTHQAVGVMNHPFQLILEAVLDDSESYLAIDEIRLAGCADDNDGDACGLSADGESSIGRGFSCPSPGKCLRRDKVCDLHEDCIPDGTDELQDCDRVPVSAACSFENGACGWRKGSKSKDSEFKLVQEVDHTYENGSGHVMKAQFTAKNSKFGDEEQLNSIQFEAPPYYHRNVHSTFYNSCQVRFSYVIESLSNHGHFYLHCVQDAPADQACKQVLWEEKQKPTRPAVWRRAVVAIPALTHSYSLRFTATRGIKPGFNVWMDDITLSPECFGIGVPPNESRSEDFVTPSNEPANISRRYSFSSCGSEGRNGPNTEQCQKHYNSHGNLSVQISASGLYPGVQLWTVPETGLYSIVAGGASGGNGVHSKDPGKGAMVRGIFNLTQGEVIAFLVGQKGTDACSKMTSAGIQRAQCPRARRIKRSKVSTSKITDLRFLKKAEGGGGGGGGGTFVYKPMNMVPLLVAAGGGGLSAEKSDPTHFVNPDGAGPNTALVPSNGALVIETKTTMFAGPGGGWNDTTHIKNEYGRSLTEGGTGGESCNKDWSSHGGFGGGGGSCTGGGGGGGYRGGDAGDDSNGQGGVSFVSSSAEYPIAESGLNKGDGYVNVFPTQRGCGCQHLCLPLDMHEGNRAASTPPYLCLCPDGLKLDGDGKACRGTQGPLTNKLGDQFQLPTHHLVVIILCILVTVAVILFFLLLAFNRYRRKQTREMNHEPLRTNPEVQLSRLRQAAAAGGGGSAAGAVTEYNPNYEFGGSTCTLQDLREIPRENLTLVKALGQGAFGEVYQGYLANAPGETSEIAVAVKTLPEVSSGQAEQDFMIEALIMSKFTHANIVRFLGVCFQKLPRFIVLELLPGGDLKSFLREARPKPAKPSPLSMADLLRLAIDVAKGCQYLEENHFIHRDIAARNCLLTSKGPDRVVKIADFGMARDIYKADYYRKGGKAMLPVKWMPPEAFLDGVFTSKTDVWSFGVLLWEVLSMGYMPYPGRGNQEVMQLVTSGGRLEPPTNCPGPVYHIMMQCWHPVPEERPAFATILERLGYCVQDPDVVSAPLPVFHRPPSMEKDATLMRPPDGSDGCLQVIQQHGQELQSPGSEDYLIPMPSSNYSLSTERTELQSSAESVDRLLRLDEELLEGATGGCSDTCWSEHDTPAQAETCFSASRASLEALPLAPASPRDIRPQPLDAAALNRLTNRPLPYVNVDVTGMSSFDEAANC